MKKVIKNLIFLTVAILTCGFILTSCSDDEDLSDSSFTDKVEAQLQKMTLREKVGQLFFVRPEVLDTTIHYGHTGGIDASTADLTKIKLQAVNATMLAVNEKYPVGGIILYAHNIEDEAQLTAFIPKTVPLKARPYSASTRKEVVWHASATTLISTEV